MDYAANIKRLKDLTTQLQTELLGLETAMTAPEQPSTTGPRLVDFASDDILYNTGSWDKYPDAWAQHSVEDPNHLQITLSQPLQPQVRVLRRDYGLRNPKGGFLREPLGVLRRYELTVEIPESYSAPDKTVVFQFHPQEAGSTPYLQWMIWNNTTRWLHEKPDGARTTWGKAVLERSHRYKLEVIAVWSPAPNGFIEVWQDGLLISGHVGATCDDQPPYLLFGMYRPGTKAAFSDSLILRDLRRVGDA